MIKIARKEECTGCHACYNVCPKKCIDMKFDEEGFLYPSVDSDKCVECGLCEKVCPIIHTVEVENEPIAVGCYNKDEKIRMNSSSGGIFTLISELVIQSGGVVFGAEFDENYNLQPKLVDSYNISSNNKSIDITLKDNIKWHNGQSLTASDVKYTYDLIKKNTDSSYYSLVSNISKISVNGSKNLTITFKDGYAFSLETLIFPIVSKDKLDNLKSDKLKLASNNLIGNGAYKIKTYEDRNYMLLELNKDYYDLDKNNNKKEVYPVGSFVFYTGDEEWKLPETLKETLKSIPSEMEPYINDWRLPVIDLKTMDARKLTNRR